MIRMDEINIVLKQLHFYESTDEICLTEQDFSTQIMTTSSCLILENNNRQYIFPY
jgi:hypothetical protein